MINFKDIRLLVGAVIFLLIFGFWQLSLANLSNSDFSFVGTNYKNGDITLARTGSGFVTNLYTNPIYSDMTENSVSKNSPFSDSYPMGYHTGLGGDYDNAIETSQYYCLGRGSSDYYDYTIDTYSGFVVTYNTNINQWVAGSHSPVLLDSITCKLNDYASSGYFETSIPILLSQDYESFDLQYQSTLNGETITPYLIYNGQLYEFTNDKLTLFVSSGNTVRLKFVLETTQAQVSPIISSSITLNGVPYSVSSENSVTDQISEKITELELSEPLEKLSENRLASYLGDIVFNFISSFFDFLKDIFSIFI